MNAPTTTNAPTFGERLARARMWAGLSQQDMAERLDCHKRSIANYETGRRMPQTDVTVAWATICGVDVELLVEPLRGRTFADVCTGQLTLDDVVIDLRDGRARTYIAAAA
jgi:transcriptional regulator with XRE-family HTH domain